MSKSIGALEFSSISRGIYTADAIVKKADVEIIYFKLICPGKFIVIISGDEGEVDTAINYGVSVIEKGLVDSFKVHAVSEAIIRGMKHQYDMNPNTDAFGIVETRKVCTGIRALDTVLKAADVTLIRIHLAFAIGGKFVFVVMGSVSAVEYGINECKDMLSPQEVENIAIIPSPNEEIRNQLMKR